MTRESGERRKKPTTAILLDGAMAAPARDEALMAVLNIVRGDVDV